MRWPAGGKRHPVDNDAARPFEGMNGARRSPFVWTGCVLAVQRPWLRTFVVSPPQRGKVAMQLFPAALMG